MKPATTERIAKLITDADRSGYASVFARSIARGFDPDAVTTIACMLGYGVTRRGSEPVIVFPRNHSRPRPAFGDGDAKRPRRNHNDL